MHNGLDPPWVLIRACQSHWTDPAMKRMALCALQHKSIANCRTTERLLWCGAPQRITAFQRSARAEVSVYCYSAMSFRPAAWIESCRPEIPRQSIVLWANQTITADASLFQRFWHKIRALPFLWMAATRHSVVLTRADIRRVGVPARRINRLD